MPNPNAPSLQRNRTITPAQTDVFDLPLIRLETTLANGDVKAGQWFPSTPEKQVLLADCVSKIASRVSGASVRCKDEDGRDFALPEILNSQVQMPSLHPGKGARWVSPTPTNIDAADRLSQQAKDSAGTLAMRVTALFHDGQQRVQKRLVYRM